MRKASETVSPQFKNHPAFQTLKFHRRSPVISSFDTTYYSYSNKAWKKESNFDQTYGSLPCNGAIMGSVYSLLEANDATRAHFTSFYDIRNQQHTPITQKNWRS